jgi:branched-subunit amino acid transport protein
VVPSDPAIWTVIAAVAVGTFAFRFSFIYLFEHVEEVPAPAERALRYVAPALLAALVAPSLLVLDGSIAVVGNGRLLAGLIGALVAWRTESIIWTMVAGVGALVVLQNLL